MKKILVVDDDPTFRKLVSNLIRRAGYEVKEAKEGAEAVAAIEKNVPDLVVLDIVMPIMGGYEVFHHIRFHQKLPNLPILVVSANEEIKREVRDAAGVDFFPKSGPMALFTEKIKKFFQQSETRGLMRDQYDALQKIDNIMSSREERMIERHIQQALNRNKNTSGASQPGDFDLE